MLAAIFVYEGADLLRNPAAAVNVAGDVIDTAAEKVDLVAATKDEDLIRAAGAAQVLGGLGLATNTFRRTSATVLAGSLLPTTVAAHAFWEESDPDARQGKLLQFLKNLALFGGLVITAMDHEGEPGPVWRAEHAAEHASILADHAAELAALRRDLAAAHARSRAAETRRSVEESRRRLETGVARARGRVEGTVRQARRDVGIARRVGRAAVGTVSAVGRGSRKVASVVTPG